MKKLNLVLAGLAFALTVNAQDSKVATQTQEVAPVKSTPAQEQVKSNDHLAMKNGKMWVMKDGKATEMVKEMDMPNGSKVMTDGTVIMKDGSKVQLKDGDKMGMKGYISHGGGKDHDGHNHDDHGKMDEKKTEQK